MTDIGAAQPHDGTNVGVEDLLEIAEGPDPTVLDGISHYGPRPIAEILLAEVIDRAQFFTRPKEDVSIQFDLGFGHQRLGYALHFCGTSTNVVADWLHDPPLTIRQDLGELLRALFGPPGRQDATREMHVAEVETRPGRNDPLNRIRRSAVVAARQLVGAMTYPPPNLTDLAVRFGSDKWGRHWYTGNYERYFSPYRDGRIKILELGIGGYKAPDAGGRSLLMWKHYFRRGQVFGLDIIDKSAIAEGRIHTIKGDQADTAFLDKVGRDIGPLDIVIDDGSHINPHVIASFKALFRHIRPGGLYVIEDTQTSYWPGWDGTSTDLNSPETTMGYVKQLIDGLNHREVVRGAPYQPTYTDSTVTAVHVHHNMVVIEKGINTEQSAYAWVPRSIEQMALLDDQ